MKYIVVPVNCSAMERLDFDNCLGDDLIELILNKDDYKKLWQTHVFRIINAELKIFIDDFEDEKIVKLQDLVVVRIIIERLIYLGGDLILEKLLTQTNNAIKYETGLFFYF